MKGIIKWTSGITLAIVMSLGIFSCENLDTFADLGWQPEILGPVVNTNVNYYDFEDLINSQKDYTVNAGSIPGADPGTQLPFMPAFGPLPKFPSEYLNLFEYASLVQIDSLNATITFENVFPVPIGQGTRIVIRDSINPSIVVLDHEIDRDVPADSLYTIQILEEDLTITTTLELFVDDFQSPGSTEPVTFEEEELIIQLKIEFIKVDYAEVNPNIYYEITDTLGFDIGTIEETDYAAYSGNLFMFVTNSFPTAIDLELIFQDENNNPIDTLFTEDPFNGLYTIDAGEVNTSTGVVISPVESDKVTLLNIDEDIESISKAKFIAVRAAFKTGPTPPESYIIDEESTFNLLITADIAIDPSKVQQ